MQVKIETHFTPTDPKQGRIFTEKQDLGVNLEVRGLTEKWGGWRHRTAKIWGKKGDFAKILHELGGQSPPASLLRRPWKAKHLT